MKQRRSWMEERCCRFGSQVHLPLESIARSQRRICCRDLIVFNLCNWCKVVQENFIWNSKSQRYPGYWSRIAREEGRIQSISLTFSTILADLQPRYGGSTIFGFLRGWTKKWSCRLLCIRCSDWRSSPSCPSSWICTTAGESQFLNKPTFFENRLKGNLEQSSVGLSYRGRR